MERRRRRFPLKRPCKQQEDQFRPTRSSTQKPTPHGFRRPSDQQKLPQASFEGVNSDFTSNVRGCLFGVTGSERGQPLQQEALGRAELRAGTVQTVFIDGAVLGGDHHAETDGGVNALETEQQQQQKNPITKS